MRRLILLTIAFGIPLLWAVVPYGRRMGDFERQTFAFAFFKLAREVLNDPGAIGAGHLMFPGPFLGLLVPLYPACVATLRLAAPRSLATRKRWAWILEGIGVALLSLVGWFWAYFALLGFAFGAAAGPVLYLTIWLLPGFSALAGLAAITIGIAPRGLIARVVLGQSVLQ